MQNPGSGHGVVNGFGPLTNVAMRVTARGQTLDGKLILAEAERDPSCLAQQGGPLAFVAAPLALDAIEVLLRALATQLVQERDGTWRAEGPRPTTTVSRECEVRRARSRPNT